MKNPKVCMRALVAVAGFALSQQSGAVPGTVIRPEYPSPFVPVSISADGQTIAGMGPQDYYGPPAAVWSPAIGFSPIGWWPSQPWHRAMSADGSKIAGQLFWTRDWRYEGAYIWSAGGFRFPPTSSENGRALALTADGSNLLWADNASSFGLYVWDGANQELITSETPFAAAISDDASIVAYISPQTGELRRWTRGAGLSTLPPPPGAVVEELDVIMSADGSRVYAFTLSADSVALVRWDCAGPAVATQELCTFPRPGMGYPSAMLAGMSADEKTITFSFAGAPYIWTEGDGLRTFEDFLVSRGIEFGPHVNLQVWAMNKDATVFTGTERTLVPWADDDSTFWYLDLNNAPGFCAADRNYDRVVDDADFVMFAAAYNFFDCANGEMLLACPCDFNRDGVVDDADFAVFAGAYDDLVCP